MDINWLNANYLPWLILLFPLGSFLLIVLVTNRRVVLSQIIALAGISIAWLLSMLLFVKTVWTTDKSLGRDVFGSSLNWLDLGKYTVRMGVMVDPLTAYMLLMVPLVCLLIFIYSLGYMRGDEHNSRFFAYISLFAGAMLTLVLAGDMLMLFIGWEVMGFCSYSLIGFWFHKKSAMQAGVKAFMTTRVADVLMLVGIGYLLAVTTTLPSGPGPTLNFRDILYNEEMLKHLVDTKAAIFGGSAASLIGVLLVIGTIGKSAQFPLHTWLPDAMEGPTPVSAMIHAATMVSAGVYMVVRMFPLLSAGTDFVNFSYNAPMVLMGLTGSVTALGAAVLAVGQNDIKRILAYSTISQLGYMVAALGIGAWFAAAFHLVNHAFFKALLFMASGSVIHSMQHGEHAAAEFGHSPEHHEEPDGLVMDYCAPPNDIQRMGGLLHRLPVTAITMAIGGLSLAGFPLVTAGFWSKDEIIAEAWHGAANHPFPLLILVLLLTAAGLTAYYTARMWFLTFWGVPRTAAAEYSSVGSLRKQWVVWWNRHGWDKNVKLTQEPITTRDRLSFGQMELPLVILAFFAITAGFIGIPKAIFGRNLLYDFLAPTLLERPEALGFNIWPMLFSIVIVLGALGLGYWVYGIRPLRQGEIDPTEWALGPGIWRTLQNRFYIDILYRRYLLRPVQWFAERVVIQSIDKETIDGVLETIAELFTHLGEFFKRFNTIVIDGTVDGTLDLLLRFSRWFRQLQTGRVQQYLLFVTLALLAIGTLLIIQVR
ncbi:MAG TPA: NADH-quinone oxidoreductase subunit L [Aggregatilineaceae bacterium]|nr:NADH-quinone oxidoreductase subunit L [Aggregatilineaceae bacterium]